jgi:hypothetical protein
MDGMAAPRMTQTPASASRTAAQAEQHVRLHMAPASDTHAMAPARVIASGLRRADEPKAGAGGVRPQLTVNVPADTDKSGKRVKLKIVTVKQLQIRPMEGLSESPTGPEMLSFIRQLVLDPNKATLRTVCADILARIDHLAGSDRTELLKVKKELLAELVDKVAALTPRCIGAKQSTVVDKLIAEIGRRWKHVDADQKELQELQVLRATRQPAAPTGRVFFQEDLDVRPQQLQWALDLLRSESIDQLADNAGHFFQLLGRYKSDVCANADLLSQLTETELKNIGSNLRGCAKLLAGLLSACSDFRAGLCSQLTYSGMRAHAATLEPVEDQAMALFNIVGHDTKMIMAEQLRRKPGH